VVWARASGFSGTAERNLIHGSMAKPESSLRKGFVDRRVMA